MLQLFLVLVLHPLSGNMETYSVDTDPDKDAENISLNNKTQLLHAFLDSPITEDYLKLRDEFGIKRSHKGYDGIILTWNGRKFVYANGNVGELPSKKKQEVKAGKKPPRSVRKTRDALTELEQHSSTAKKIIDVLAHSKYEFTIDIRDQTTESYVILPINEHKKGFVNNNGYALQILQEGNEVVDYAAFNSIGSGATIIWSPINHDQFILIHELAHAFDSNFGLLRNEIIVINDETINTSEIRAIAHENLVRMEFNQITRKEELIFGFLGSQVR